MVETAGEGTAGDGDGGRDRMEEGRMEAFWRRAARGDFGELLDGRLRAAMAAAAAERGLTLEIGALRVALTRVLMEEGDAAAQSLAISRVARATAMLLKQQDEIEEKEQVRANYVRINAEIEEQKRLAAERWNATQAAAVGGGAEVREVAVVEDRGREVEVPDDGWDEPGTGAWIREGVDAGERAIEAYRAGQVGAEDG